MKIIIIVIIIVIIIFAIIKLKKNKEYVNIIGKCGLPYRVIKNIKSQKAADILCELNTRCLKLIKYLKKKYIYNNKRPIYSSYTYKEIIKLLDDEYDIDDFQENAYSTFNIGKGEKIHMVLSSDGKFFDIETLMFVALHELSHIITKPRLHNPEFWNNNIWLMKEAITCGVYKSINYKYYPVTYSKNVTISYNPLYDRKFINYISQLSIIEKYKDKNMVS